MARPKKVVVEFPQDVAVVVDIPTQIEKVAIDYGREDINNLAKKLNEVIEKINAL